MRIFTPLFALILTVCSVFGQGTQVIRTPLTTNQMMNAPQDFWIPIWNNVAKRWSNGVNTASATNASQPPTTTLTNISATGAITNLNDNQFDGESTIAAVRSGAQLTNLVVRAASGTSRAIMVNTNVLVVTNGNVGVGTDAPDAKLRVVGEFIVTGGDITAHTSSDFRNDSFAGDFVLVTDVGPNAAIAESSVTTTELNQLSGVTGGVQAQLNNRIANLSGRGTNTTFLNITNLGNFTNAGNIIAQGLLSADGGLFANNPSTVSALTVQGIFQATAALNSFDQDLTVKGPLYVGAAGGPGTIYANEATAGEYRRVLTMSPAGYIWGTNGIANIFLGSSHRFDGVVTVNSNVQAHLLRATNAIIPMNVTASRALVSAADGTITNSAGVTTTELEFMDGVTSAIQTQLSNDVRVVAGTGGITVTASGSGAVMTYTVNDDDAGGGGGSTNVPVIAIGTQILTNGTIYKPLDIGSATNIVLSWNTNYYVASPSNVFTISWTDVPASTDGRQMFLKLINTNASAGFFPTNGLNGGSVILLPAASTNEYTFNYDTNGFWIRSGQILTTGNGDTNVFNISPNIHTPTNWNPTIADAGGAKITFDFGASFTDGDVLTAHGTGGVITNLPVGGGGGGGGISASTATNIAVSRAGTETWLNVLDFGADPTGAADSTAAISNALFAALGSTNGPVTATIYFPAQSVTLPGVYLVSGATNGPEGAQIVIPERFWASDGYTNASQVRFLGPQGRVSTTGSNSGGKKARGGATIISTVTNLNGHVFASGFSRYQKRSFTVPIFEGLIIQTLDDFRGTVLMLTNAIECSVSDCIFSKTNEYGSMSAMPQTNSCAIDGPMKDGGSQNYFKNVEISGYYYGIRVGEHVEQQGLLEVAGCVYGVVQKAANIPNTWEHITIQGCEYGFYFEGTGYNDVQLIYTERLGTADWRTNIADIYDPSNFGRGTFRWKVKDLIATSGDHKPRVTGDNLLFIESTYDPLQTMQVLSSSVPPALRGPHHYYTDNSTRSGQITVGKSRGTGQTPTTVSSGDTLGGFSWVGHDGNAWTNSGNFIYSTMRASASAGLLPASMDIYTGTNATVTDLSMRIEPDGKVGVGAVVPTAWLSVSNHTTASMGLRVDTIGTSAQDVAAFRKGNGDVFTVKTNGITVGAGSVLTNLVSATATLDFASQSVGGVEDLPITVAGAADGDDVSIGVPVGSVGPVIGTFSGFASNGVVYVRFIANAATQDPASGTFRATIRKFQ